ncbi:MAG: hypothetical protein IT458_11095 [Planctomycetes bacterium]|nr:hypothetical protein [Planctomycetota bacterium]
MHKLLLPVPLLALGFSSAAQGPVVTYITPRGAEFFEGSSSSDIMLGNWAAQTRTQQVDNNLVGQPLPFVRFIGWRRNGSSNAGAAKTTNLTVICSHADYNTVTNTFATNYKDQPVTVFTKKPVNLPDWNAPSGSTPSPFNVILPFDTPFLYNGTDALLYDVLNENNPLGTYSQDWISGTMPHTYGAYPTDLGGGCTTANGPMVHRCALRANATVLELGFKVSGAPASANVVMLIGASDPALPIPGLCGVLHTQPVLDLALTPASAAGNIAISFPVRTPWSPALAGITLYTQAVAPDAGQSGLPIAISNGLRSDTPATGGAGAINVKRIYHTSSVTAATGTGPSVSAVPTLFGY